jgi:hypothetical protein
VGGILLAVAGMGGLILGVVLHNWFVGPLGFAVMFGGVMLAVGVRTRRVPAGFPSAPGARPAGFMDRLAQRWERRRQS